ncbi:hypothetical protein V8C42DRAFT_346396 [Trichoderma barbatum]
MDSTSHHRANIVDEANVMDASWDSYVDRISTFKGQKSDFTSSLGDFLTEANSQGSPATFDGSSFNLSAARSSVGAGAGDDDVPPQQLEIPRRSLANTHILPAQGSEDDGDDGDDGDDDDEDDLEVFLIDFADYAIDAIADLSDPLDQADSSALVTPDSSSSHVQSQDDQTAQQRTKIFSYLQALNARNESGKRGDSCCHKQAQPVVRTEAENIQSNDEKTAPKDGSHKDGLGDFVMVDKGEDEDEEEMTDSCLNLVSHLDYVMFPTPGVLEFVRGGEMEVQEDSDNEEAFCRRFLEENYYDEDNKELGGEIGEPGPKVVQVRSLVQDVTRRLHRLRNGC